MKGWNSPSLASLLQSLVTVCRLKRQQSASFISLHIPYLSPAIPSPPLSPPPPDIPQRLSHTAVSRPLSCFPPLMSKHCGLWDHGETWEGLRGCFSRPSIHHISPADRHLELPRPHRRTTQVTQRFGSRLKAPPTWCWKLGWIRTQQEYVGWVHYVTDLSRCLSESEPKVSHPTIGQELPASWLWCAATVSSALNIYTSAGSDFNLNHFWLMISFVKLNVLYTQ